MNGDNVNMRFYAVVSDKTTALMEGVVGRLPEEMYERMASIIGSFANPTNGGYLGDVHVETSLYDYDGVGVLLPQGVAQVGVAKTEDNRRTGFRMIRLFANTDKEMRGLEKFCGLC